MCRQALNIGRKMLLLPACVPSGTQYCRKTVHLHYVPAGICVYFQCFCQHFIPNGTKSSNFNLWFA